MPSLQELRNRPTLRFREVQMVLGNCCRSTVYRHIERGNLSPPAKPTERCALFDTEEVFALITPDEYYRY